MPTQVSSVITGAATITAVQVSELVQWGLNGFPHPVPSNIPMILAALIFTGAHAVVNLIQSRNGAAK